MLNIQAQVLIKHHLEMSLYYTKYYTSRYYLQHQAAAILFSFFSSALIGGIQLSEIYSNVKSYKSFHDKITNSNLV